MRTSILSETQEVPVWGTSSRAPELACHVSNLGGLATTWRDKMPQAHYTALPSRSHTQPQGQPFLQEALLLSVGKGFQTRPEGTGMLWGRS